MIEVIEVSMEKYRCTGLHNIIKLFIGHQDYATGLQSCNVNRVGEQK